MANIKQQIKRVGTNDKARLANNSFKSSLKTTIKAVLTSSNKEEATTLLATAYKKLDKAEAKGIVHKNYVSRKKSQLATHVNSL